MAYDSHIVMLGCLSTSYWYFVTVFNLFEALILPSGSRELQPVEQNIKACWQAWRLRQLEAQA